MSKETRQLPAKELRLGSMKLSIWRNEGNGRPFFKSTFCHVYRLAADQREEGDNGWRETTSFGLDDLVLITELTRLAGKWIRQQEVSPVLETSTES